MTDASALNHFEQHARRYAAWTQTSRGFEERVDVFRALVDGYRPRGGDGAICMDLGCGTGALGSMAAERGFAVTAIDGSAEMLAVARQAEAQRGDRISDFRQERLPLGEDTLSEFQGRVDLIITSSVVEYLSEAEANSFLGQISRLLTPQGRALISFPNRQSLYWRSQRWVGVRTLLKGRDASVQQQRWTPADVRQAAGRHGLDMDESRYFALPLQERLAPVFHSRPPWMATLFVAALSPRS